MWCKNKRGKARPMAKEILEVISLPTYKNMSSLKVQVTEDRDGAAIEEVKMVQKDHMVSVRFPAKRRDVGKHLFNALLKGKTNVA